MGVSILRLKEYYVEDEHATMQFYDRDGKRVKRGSTDAVVQYLSNDPNRPDADGMKAATAPDEDKSVKAPAEDKSVKTPAETK